METSDPLVTTSPDTDDDPGDTDGCLVRPDSLSPASVVNEVNLGLQLTPDPVPLSVLLSFRRDVPGFGFVISSAVS